MRFLCKCGAIERRTKTRSCSKICVVRVACTEVRLTACMCLSLPHQTACTPHTPHICRLSHTARSCAVSLTRILLHPSVGSHASSLLALAASASPASAAGPSLGPRTNDSLLWHELGTWRLWPYSPPQTHTDALFCIDNPAALPRASATSSDSTPSDRIAETRTIAMGAARGLANLSLVRRLRLRILRSA